MEIRQYGEQKRSCGGETVWKKDCMEKDCMEKRLYGKKTV